MDPKPSEFLNASEISLEIWRTLIEAVLSRGGTDEHLRRIITDKTLQSRLARLIVPSAVGTIFPVSVDYSRSLLEVILAGEYIYVNRDIKEERFPLTENEKGKVSLKLELIRLNKVASEDEVRREIKIQGYRSAKLREELAFGEKYPYFQRKYPVVALGSPWQNPFGYEVVPCLGMSESERALDLCPAGGVWAGFYHFLVVREFKSSDFSTLFRNLF